MSDLPRPNSLPVHESAPVGSSPRTPLVFTPGPADVRYGGFWIRSVASLIDNVLLLLLCVILGFVQGIVAPNASYGTFRGQVVFQLVSFAISVFYYGSVQAKYQGTPGKRLLGLRLVGSDLTPVEMSRCYARYFASVLSGLALGLGYIWAAFDPKKRTWHDRMAGTLVIRDP